MKASTSHAKPRRNRSYGKRSPLDKLSDAARHELRRLCQKDTTLKEIQVWLKETHGCAVSQQTVSQWWIRKQADENAEVLSGHGAESARVCSACFEIIVTAPGASEVRVLFRPRS